MNILITIIIFSVLIVIHEFGHFICAKRAKVRVEKFSIGFGPPIFRKKGKETEFLICLFPLGGYVKMSGDTRSECRGAKHEFLSQPVGIKARIVLAGPLFNYLLALVTFCIIAMIGFPHPDTVVGKVMQDYPAYHSGLKKGDKVLEVNGVKVDNWSDMAKIIRRSEEEVLLRIRRGEEKLLIRVALRDNETLDDFGRKKTVPMIGISASRNIRVVRYKFPQALFKGAESLLDLTILVIKGFIFIFLGIVPFKEAVAGPIGIYYITSEVMKIGVVAVLHLMASLSVSLCIINLFPIPILDGGHILLFLAEKIRKKPLSERIEDNLTRAGLAFISLLIIFIFYNDIIRFGPKIFQDDKSSIQNSIINEKNK